MLDLNEINALSNADKGRYMALEKLFANPGYKYLMKFAQANLDEAVQAVLNAQTWEQHCFARGAQFAYTRLVNLEQESEAEFQALAQQAAEAAAEASEAEGNDE